jgi:tetratricopeptide (TPR) repeat protein
MLFYSAVDLAKSISDEAILTEARDALVLELLRAGSFADALSYIDGVAELQRSQSHVTQSLLHQFASQAQLTEHVRHYELQVQDACSRGDRATQASMTTRLADACADLLLFQAAVDHMAAACSLYEELGDPSSVLTCSLKLARLFMEQGACPSAIQRLKSVVQHSTDIMKRASVIGRVCPFKIFELCEAYSLLCCCEADAGLIDDALCSGKAGLVVAVEHADMAAESVMLISLANVYLQTGVLSLALEHSARALVCASQNVATSSLSFKALLLSSRISWELGDSDACLRHLNDARDLVRIGALNSEEPLFLCEYARILRKRGQPAEALDHLRRAAAGAKLSAKPNPRLACLIAVQTAKLHAANGMLVTSTIFMNSYTYMHTYIYMHTHTHTHTHTYTHTHTLLR